MIELRTLGTLDLRDRSDGRALQSVLAQPKRAAFLAYLAVSGPGRFHRRDTLLGVFWPESPEKQARHSLSQAVYVLRRALGAEAIITRGEEELALSAEHVWCDAVEFEARFVAGEPERALELYGGELLPGFHLSDSVEFEQWLSLERMRLRSAALEAARKLGSAAEAAGDVPGTIRWLRRALELAPYEEPIARELMSHMERAGDRAGALLEFEALARRLDLDLEIEPSAETVASADAIRTRIGRTPKGLRAKMAPEPGERPGRVTATTRHRRARKPARTRRGVGRRLLLLAPLVLLATVVPLLLWRTRPTAASPDPAADRVAVLPFDVRGNERLAYLGEGVALLLSAKLDGAGSLRVVDPEAVLNFADAQDSPNRDALGRAAARRFRAAQFALGSVVEAGGRISLQVGLYDADGTLRAQATGDATDESGIFALVDDVARTLIESRYGADADRLTLIAAQTTLSLPALKAYLAGEHAFRRGRFAEAASAFEQAAVADSTFALAHYRLSLASLWANAPDTLPFDADARALRHSTRLSDHDRHLLIAYDAWRRGDAYEAERIYRNVLALYPDDTEAALQLGETLFHYNPVRGRSISEARAPFEHVTRLDANSWGALWHLLLIAGSERRQADFDALAQRLERLGSEPSQSLELRTLVAFAAHDEAAIARLIPELRAAHPLHINEIAWRIAVHLHDPAGARRVARLGSAAHRHPFARQAAHIQLAHLEMALGRDREAARELGAIGALGSGASTEVAAAFSLILPFRDPPVARLEEQLRAMRHGTSSDHDASYLELRPYVLGTLELALGDTVAVSRRATKLELRGSGPDDDLRPFAEGLRAALDLRGNRPAAAVDRLDAEPLRRWFGWASTSHMHSGTYLRWLRAEALGKLGRHEEAIGWYAGFGEGAIHDLAFLAPSHLRRAEIYDARGRRADAAVHYAAFVGLWADADPELQPIVERARERLRALGHPD